MSEKEFGEEGGPVSSFQSMAAEGDILAKTADYRKAIEAYTKALTLRPNDKGVLVARSRCYLAIGENQLALVDAETSLKEDPEFFKGKFQKAEALYAKGDFEMALVYYHRGHQLRPELDEFRLGIQKAREAIDNSIGNPRDYKKSSKTGTPGSDAIRQEKRPTASKPGQQQAQAGGTNITKLPPQQERTVKILLGDLYEDKAFLESLYHDRDFVTNPNEAVRQLVFEGLKFLEARTEFWRQQKPLYARKKEGFRPKSQSKPAGDAKKSEETHGAQPLDDVAIRRKYGFDTTEGAQKWIDERWAHLQTALDNGNVDKAARLARTLLFEVSEKDPKALEVLKLLPNKEEWQCRLYGTLGTIYQQLKHPREVETWSKKELHLARRHNFQDSQSDALGKLGRVYVQQAKYQEAAKCWQEKLPLVQQRYQQCVADAKAEAALNAAIEITWLRHDLAKCSLALSQNSKAAAAKAHLQTAETHANEAHEWANKSVASIGGGTAAESVPLAKRIQEDGAAAEAYRWLLYTLVLKAQVLEAKASADAAAKSAAASQYKAALELAQKIQDTNATSAIETALQAIGV